MSKPSAVTKTFFGTEQVKHTPGPWRACHDGTCACGFIWGADHETHVASAHGPSALGADWYGSDVACNSDIQTANAHLIAAAPDMLEALKRLVEIIYETDGHAQPCSCPACAGLRAIAKAEGRAS